jgi:hypothetical protein
LRHGWRTRSRPTRTECSRKVLKEYAEATSGETEIALPREILTGPDFSSDLAPRSLRSFSAFE